jgi:hypothetical protein
MKPITNWFSLHRNRGYIRSVLEINHPVRLHRLLYGRLATTAN